VCVCFFVVVLFYLFIFHQEQNYHVRNATTKTALLIFIFLNFLRSRLGNRAAYLGDDFNFGLSLFLVVLYCLFVYVLM